MCCEQEQTPNDPDQSPPSPESAADSQQPTDTFSFEPTLCVPAVPLACLLTGGYWWWLYQTECTQSAAWASFFYFFAALTLMGTFALVALARTCHHGDTSCASGVEVGVTALLSVLIVAIQLGVCVLGLVLSLEMLDCSIQPKLHACPATAGCAWLVLTFFLSVVLVWTRLHPAPAWMEKKAFRGGFAYQTVSLFLFRRKDFLTMAGGVKI